MIIIDERKLESKIFSILYHEASKDVKRFHNGDTILYTPTEVAKIIKEHIKELEYEGS